MVVRLPHTTSAIRRGYVGGGRCLYKHAVLFGAALSDRYIMGRNLVRPLPVLTVSSKFIQISSELPIYE